MRIPQFVARFQHNLLCRPEGRAMDSGRWWLFTSPDGEVTVTEFVGSFDTEFTILTPDNEEFSASTETDVSQFLHRLLGGHEAVEADIAEEFGNLDVVQEDDNNWTLTVPGTEVYFMVRQNSKGYIAAFVSDDGENETGGPFPKIEGLKKFVFTILSTLRQPTERPVEPEEVEEPEEDIAELLQSSAENISSACSDLDRAGYSNIADYLTDALSAISEALNENENEGGLK